MNQLTRAVLLAIVMACAGVFSTHVQAQVKLRDLAPVQQNRILMEWNFNIARGQLGAQGVGNELNRVTAKVDGVDYRLDVTAYLGKAVKIFYVWPNFTNTIRPNASFTVEWITQGRLSSGKLGGAGRVMVFNGKIQDAVLNERFGLRLSMDARDLTDQIQLQPYFELEVN
jgi:hypothetical protein